MVHVHLSPGWSKSIVIFQFERRLGAYIRDGSVRQDSTPSIFFAWLSLRRTRPDTRHKMRLVCVLSTFGNNTGHTDGRTDRGTDGRTDGRTRRLITMAKEKPERQLWDYFSDTIFALKSCCKAYLQTMAKTGLPCSNRNFLAILVQILSTIVSVLSRETWFDFDQLKQVPYKLPLFNLSIQFNKKSMMTSYV